MTHKYTFLGKDPNSIHGDCPALIQADALVADAEDGYAVVGKRLSASARAEVVAVCAANDSGIGADEDVVFIPASVLKHLRGA